MNGLDPLGAVAGFGAVFLVGVLKKLMGMADSRLVEIMKPIQPWLALALSVGIPIVVRATGIEVDQQALIQAPVSTLVAIGAREVYARLKPVAP